MSALKTLSLCALLLAAIPAQAQLDSATMNASANDVAPVKSLNGLHDVWTGILGRYIETEATGLNRFDYQALKNSPNDTGALTRYIEQLSSQTISALPRNDQFAAWANLYNALTVRLIIENYPVDSIRDIRSGLFSAGPWKRDIVVVEGQTLTLDDIEHEILRKEFKDPRVHYAVNCASVGCPNLRKEAFIGETLDGTLNQAARDYINHPRGVHFTDRGELVASKIYSWFQEDFGGSEAGVIDHLKRYAYPELASRLSTLADIRRFEYDWSLNDTSPKGRK